MQQAPRVVVDSQPLIALLLGEPAAEAVEALLRADGAQISTVSIAEVLDVLNRREGLPWDDVELVLAGLLSEALDAIAPGVDAAAPGSRRAPPPLRPASLPDLPCRLLRGRYGAAWRERTGDRVLLDVARTEGLDVVDLEPARN